MRRDQARTPAVALPARAARPRTTPPARALNPRAETPRLEMLRFSVSQAPAARREPSVSTAIGSPWTVLFARAAVPEACVPHHPPTQRLGYRRAGTIEHDGVHHVRNVSRLLEPVTDAI